MEYNRLGNTPFRVSQLGLGGAFGKETNDHEIQEIVHAAIDLGINFIDTAHAYVESERRIGAALRGRRDQVILATKTGTLENSYSYENTILSVEESLRRLQTDYIDLIQLHVLEICGDKRAMEETLPAYNKLKEQGKVRAIGVSARRADSMVPYVREGLVDVVQPFGTYTLIDHTAEDVLFPYTREHQVGVILASPLWMGILAENPARYVYKKKDMLAEAERRKLEIGFLRKSDEPGGLIEPAMRFCLSNPDIAVTLTGTKSVSQLKMNISYCDGKGLKAEDQQRILALFRGESLQ